MKSVVVVKRLAYAGVSLIALAASNAADAANGFSPPYAWGYVAPYPKNWDSLIGYDFWTRLINYYALEMGHDTPPPDPTAPEAAKAGRPRRRAHRPIRSRSGPTAARPQLA